MSDDIRVHQVKGFLRVNQILKLLGIGKSTFYRWVEEGKLSKGIRLGDCIKVWKVDEIEAFIENAGVGQEVES